MYLLFISYKNGGHYNTICHSSEELSKYIRNVVEDENTGRTEMIPSIENIDGIHQDKWFELSNGTWFTITRVNDYARQEMKKGLAETRRKEIYDVIDGFMKAHDMTEIKEFESYEIESFIEDMLHYFGVDLSDYFKRNDIKKIDREQIVAKIINDLAL